LFDGIEVNLSAPIACRLIQSFPLTQMSLWTQVGIGKHWSVCKPSTFL